MGLTTHPPPLARFFLPGRPQQRRSCVTGLGGLKSVDVSKSRLEMVACGSIWNVNIEIANIVNCAGLST